MQTTKQVTKTAKVAVKVVEKRTEALSEVAVLTKEILRLKEATTRNFVEIGKRLNRARELMKHGDWLEWLNNEVYCSVRTAQRFMRLANTPTLAHLGVGKAEILLPLPEKKRLELVKGVVEIPKTGEKKKIGEVSVRELRQVVRKVRRTIEPDKRYRVSADKLVKGLERLNYYLDKFKPKNEKEKTKLTSDHHDLLHSVLTKLTTLTTPNPKK